MNLLDDYLDAKVRADHKLLVPFVTAGTFIGGFAGVIYNMHQVSLRQAITPERMQGRMNATMRFLVWGTIPIGSIIGGVLGTLIGLAFQAQDDYLGTWGDPGDTGKSNSNDIARKKKTLPIVYGMDDADARAVIAEAYDTGGDVGAAAIVRVVSALEDAGADVACREMAAGYAHEADALLDGLGLPEGTRTLLREVARYLVDRAG